MSLARNAAFNLLGGAAPAVLSLLTIPYIVRSLGSADFGLLTLVTAVVGYFAILDINMTAGTVRHAAGYHAAGDQARLHQTLTFGFVTYLVIGVVGMAGLLLGADLLVGQVLNVEAARRAQAALAVRIAALGFLFGQIQAYLNSLPGALLRYDVSGRLEAVFGTALPLLTVAFLALGGGLVEVVVLRVAMSATQALVLVACLRGLLPAFAPSWPARELRVALLSFSGYAFLSRLAAVTYAHADKLVIGARTGLSAVAYYTVPTTLSNRVMALVFRLSGVMFPHASALAATGRTDELLRLYLLGSRQLFFVNGGIAVLLACLAQPILSLWMGADFARQGAAVMTLIALAQWIDSMTNLPSMVNDGLASPRVTGGFALARAVLGLLCIVVGVDRAGIVGAAAGHVVASAVMTAAFLGYVHGRTIPLRLAVVARQAYLPPLAVLLPVAALAWMLAPMATDPLRLAATATVVILFGLAGGWWFVLGADLRQRLAAALVRRGND